MTNDPGPSRSVAIDLTEASSLWQRLPDAEDHCRAAASAALAATDLAPDGPAELSLVLADDAQVQDLNRVWRGKDKPTNVLSFPVRDAALPAGAPVLLGDVVLAYETITAEAEAQGKPVIDHLRHLVVHGVLHLLGFDHEESAEAERMEALETAVLAGLGVADPYREREVSHG